VCGPAIVLLTTSGELIPADCKPINIMMLATVTHKMCLIDASYGLVVGDTVCSVAHSPGLLPLPLPSRSRSIQNFLTPSCVLKSTSAANAIAVVMPDNATVHSTINKRFMMSLLFKKCFKIFILATSVVITVARDLVICSCYGSTLTRL
jgi:hypothetical protein